MAATSISVTAVGASNAIPINLGKFRWGVGIIVTIPSGTSAVYDVQVTGDEPKGGFSNWNLHDIMQGLSASSNGNLAFPVSAIRINLQSIIGPGPVVFSVVQVDG